MKEQDNQANEITDRHPLITLGLLTVGTQMGTALIQKMGRHPFLLFAMGATAGVYTYKNRKEIIAEAQHLKEQGKNFLSKQPKAE